MSSNTSDEFVGAIDQGTSSTRFLIFNVKTQEVVASHQEREWKTENYVKNRFRKEISRICMQVVFLINGVLFTLKDLST